MIITIIVMLILVGVTINVALNGGLFDKAKTAAAKTEQEALYEELVASTVYTNSGEIDVVSTYNAFKEGKTVAELTTGNLDQTTRTVVFEIEGKTGTYSYSITNSKVMKGAIPWVTRGLTAEYVNYDKKYCYIYSNVEYYLFFNTNGGMMVKVDPTNDDDYTSEEVDQFIVPISSFTSDSMTMNPNTYTIYNNDTLTITNWFPDNLFVIK